MKKAMLVTLFLLFSSSVGNAAHVYLPEVKAQVFHLHSDLAKARSEFQNLLGEALLANVEDLCVDYEIAVTLRNGFKQKELRKLQREEMENALAKMTSQEDQTKFNQFVESLKKLAQMTSRVVVVQKNVDLIRERSIPPHQRDLAISEHADPRRLEEIERSAVEMGILNALKVQGKDFEIVLKSVSEEKASPTHDSEEVSTSSGKEEKKDEEPSEIPALERKEYSHLPQKFVEEYSQLIRFNAARFQRDFLRKSEAEDRLAEDKNRYIKFYQQFSKDGSLSAIRFRTAFIEGPQKLNGNYLQYLEVIPDNLVGVEGYSIYKGILLANGVGGALQRMMNSRLKDHLDWAIEEAAENESKFSKDEISKFLSDFSQILIDFSQRMQKDYLSQIGESEIGALPVSKTQNDLNELEVLTVMNVLEGRDEYIPTISRHIGSMTEDAHEEMLLKIYSELVYDRYWVDIRM